MKLERHAGRTEVRRRRADVVEKAGEEVGLGAGREVGEMLRDDCRACELSGRKEKKHPWLLPWIRVNGNVYHNRTRAWSG